MRPFIDTSVFIYATGSGHPLRDPCARVLARMEAGELEATTSAEVVQEIVHRFLAIRRVDEGLLLAQRVMEAFMPVLPVTHSVVARVPGLARRYPNLAARDLVHVATCIEEGIPAIATTDRGFDQVVEVRRIDPRELAA